MNDTKARLPIRLVLEGKLKMHGAYASVGTEVKESADATILKDGQGRVLLSGTGLKGQLRGLMVRIMGESQANSLFGVQDSVSRIVVFDSSVAVEEEARHRVAIDRKRGTAAKGLLFDQEVAGPGTAFPIRIVIHGDRDTIDSDRKAFAWIKTLLEWGAVTPGGDSRRGAGHCVLTDASVSEYDKTDKSQLISWLAGQRAFPTNAVTFPAFFSDARRPLRIMAADLLLMFEDGVLVADKNRGEETDIAAYQMRDAKGRDRFVLPGGGVRGVLRRHMEQTWRLLGAENVCDPTEAGGWCSEIRKKDGARNDGGDLCPVCRLFGAIGWRAPLAISDFVEEGGRTCEQLIDHVAINRFTGGAEESKKFDESPVFRGKFRGRVLLENPDMTHLALLGHLGLMAHDGELWFGHSTHRGIGRITKLTVLRLRLLQSAPWDAKLPPPFDGAVPVIEQEGGRIQWSQWSQWMEKLEPVMGTLQEVDA